MSGDLFRSIDWSRHPLGAVEGWSPALKTMLSVVFNSKHPMFIWWGPELYQFYNDGYLPSFGIGKHPQAMGQRGEDCWQEIWPIIKPQIDLVMEKGGATWNENQLVPIFRNGRIEDVYWTYGYSPIFDSDGSIGGTLVVCTETTNQVLTEKMLQQNEARLQRIFAKAPVPIAIFEGPEHRFRFCNDKYIQYFLGGKDYKGKRVEEILPHVKEQGLTKLLDKAYEAGERFDGKERRVVSKDSDGTESELFFNYVCDPIRDDQGGIEGLIAVLSDVTDSVNARKHLEEAKIAADHSNKTKSAFLANMSHEIRTPLGAIIGFADILKSLDDPDERAKYIDIIVRNGHSLSAIIDDILDLSKIEAGKLSIENTRLCLRDLTNEIMTMFADRAEEKSILFSFDDSGLPDFGIESDPVRIRQVLVNLIGNALKFTNQGRVAISARSKELDSETIQISFFVRDTGIGMSEENVSILFEPFSQADFQNSRRFGGTGLGLALSKRLDHALGGDVFLVSTELNKGSVFQFDFVAQRSSNEKGVKEATPVRGDELSSLEKLKILVVDDSEDNQVLVETYLKRQGAKVFRASDGIKAVEAAISNSVDVVLMDIQMPGIDGYEALKVLRDKGFHKPIIALTAHAMKEERIKVLAAGFKDHVTKPIDLHRLNSAILTEI